MEKPRKLWAYRFLMKKHSWFISLFGVWCLLSSLWYFLSIKGVITDPKNFNPPSALVAIVEISVMLLGACLLGYAIAWYSRDETIAMQNEKLDGQREEARSLLLARDEFKNQAEWWREKYRHDLTALQQKGTDLATEKEKLTKIKMELETTLAEERAEARAARSGVQQVENEVGTLRYRNRQLEFQVKEAEEAVIKLKAEIESLIAAQKTKGTVSDHPFVRPLEADAKDDLTKVKGIGPFIEKRLNMIGIYNFHQLADLSPEMIDRVGAAIEFFPHRIMRDNWVGQARAFAQAG